MKPCPEDWRRCGHCVVRFAPDAYPSCTKSGFWRQVFGDDMCPNAPMPDQLRDAREDGKAT